MDDAARTALLLVTSNGTGMGHLTRQTAVARAAAERADVTILSLSSGLSVLNGEGLRTEYLPSYQRPWMPRQDWNDYLADRVVALVEELGADVVSFDGVAPYRGLALARRRLPGTAFAWFRRGMWRPGRNEAALRTEPFFDLIVEPGDLAADADSGATSRRDATRVPPVSLLDVIEPLGRAEASAALGLDPSLPTALVTLGSGALGDTQGTGNAAMAVLLGAGYQVATTRAALASDDHHDGRSHLLHEVYPLARYVRAFDLVVSAAGYNAVHEFVTAGLAVALVPNDETATDDQVARARRLDELGAAVWADPQGGAAAVTAAVQRLVAERESVAAAARALVERTGRGTHDAADALVGLATSFHGDEPGVAQRLGRARFLARGAVVSAGLSALGPERADRLRQRHRARTGATLTRRLDVDLVIDAPLADSSLLLAPSDAVPASAPVARALLTNRLDREVLRRPDPVEHVLAGASPWYVARRVAIARSAYHVLSVTADAGDDHASAGTGVPV
jgi:hypothetical protein